MLSSAKMSLIPLWERQKFVATEGMAGEICSRGRGHHSEIMSCGHHCKVTWPMAKSVMPRRGKRGHHWGKLTRHRLQHQEPAGLQHPDSPLTEARGQKHPGAPVSPLCFMANCALDTILKRRSWERDGRLKNQRYRTLTEVTIKLLFGYSYLWTEISLFSIDHCGNS